MYILLVISTLLVVGCYGYRYGPPIDACTHMFPTLHGKDARSDTPPFTITVSKNHYVPNEEILVTITPQAKDPDNSSIEWFMEGVLAVARKADCSSTLPVGTFKVPDCDDFLQVIDCVGVKNNAVRHYTHLHAYQRNFTWVAPAEAQGHVYIGATIARNKDRFWVNVQSETIMDDSLTTVPTKVCPALQTKYDSRYDSILNTATHAFVPTLTIVTALIGARFV